MLALMSTLIALLLLPTMSNMTWWATPYILLMLTTMSLLYTPQSSYVSISNFFAVDSMSFALIMLSIWITALMFLASHKIYKHKNNHLLFFMVTMTLLIVLVLCFSTTNLFMFYIWFEASLIPTLMLIMLWGYQPERMQATIYMMIYTVVASLPMLVMISKVYFISMNSSFLFYILQFPSSTMLSLFWLMMIGGMLVKLPLFSAHLWLPKAHVEAPIAGSMILAAILLKLGGYGIMRLTMIFPHIAKQSSTPIISIAMCGAALTSMICLRQPDLKSLIAYSSVGHMGLLVAGCLSSTTYGISGAMAMMVAHGLCSSALFCMANFNYEMKSSRSLFLMKGFLLSSPTITMWWFIFAACNMAAPPSINLLSEILLMPAITYSTMLMIIPLSIVSFFTAAYSLHMYTAMAHGSNISYSSPTSFSSSKDMTLLIMHLTPILLLIIKPELIMFN